MKLVTAASSILLAAVSVVAASDFPKALRGGLSSTTDGNARKLPTRVINGIDAPVNRYPYTVSLQDGDFHFCGGSLIAPDLVISAAHCSGTTLSGSSARIVLNPQKLSDPIEASEVFSVEEYVSHPLYQTLSLYDHDYMIIKLTGSSSLPTVRLNTNDNLPVAGSSLQVLGWGTTAAAFAVEADTLQEVDVVTITNEECSDAGNAYENDITPDSLCAAEVNKGACQGDSGGPLVIPGSSSEKDVQVGIVSWGVGCAQPECKLFRRGSSCSAFSTNLTDSSAAFLIDPGVYARIEKEFDWIRFQVCRLSSNPPEYFSCDEGKVTFSPTPTSDPTRDEIPVLVSLELDAYGCETGWKIQDESGSVVAEVAAYSIGQSYSTVSKVVSLPRGLECNFVLSDLYGDGFNGRVVLYLGDEANNNKILGYYDQRLNGGSNYFSTIYSFAFQAGEDGIIPNVFPSEAPSSPPAAPSSGPTAPTVSPAPPSHKVSVLFDITTDSRPKETGWLVYMGEEAIYTVQNSTYTDNYTTYSTIVPLTENRECQLTLTDTVGDGLTGDVTVYLGEEASADKVLAYFDGSSIYFSYSYTLDFVVSENATSTGVFPIAAPTPSPGPYDPCNICGGLKSVTDPDAVWNYTSDVSLSCGDLELDGAQGLVSQDYCPFLPSVLSDVCGCDGPPTEAPTSAPLNANYTWVVITCDGDCSSAPGSGSLELTAIAIIMGVTHFFGL